MWIGEYILDENGEPQPEPDSLKWAMWYEHSHESKGKDNRIVQQDRIGEVLVSTIFLGLDQTFGLVPGPPTLWETMIFRGEHDGWQRRYLTRDQALGGHAEAVEMVKASQNML